MGQRSSPHCLHEGTGPTENIAFSPGNLSASRLNWAAFGRQQRAARKKLLFCSSHTTSPSSPSFLRDVDKKIKNSLANFKTQVSNTTLENGKKCIYH